MLDEDSLEQLFEELQKHAVILEVKEKSSAVEYSKDDSTAFERFRTGQTHAIQVCYRYDDAIWCDTIRRGASGYQLIRMNTSAQSDRRENNLPV